MERHDIVVVGASAGGVEALLAVVGRLPPEFPAAVFVVVHVPPAHTGNLPAVLNRQGGLPAAFARDGLAIRPGHIYVAPPDFHLLIRPGAMQLSHGPRENHTRPAIDPLFRSAARAYGPRVVGVLLSGNLGDGAIGLQAIKARGGVAVVQDPDEATYADMPRRALRLGRVDYVVPLGEIPSLLVRLAGEAAGPAIGGERMAFDQEHAEAVVGKDLQAQAGDRRDGQVSVYTCPECGGALWQIGAGDFIQFRCHVGHTYSPRLLLVDKSEELEAALWTSVRLLTEKATLTRQLAHRVAEDGDQERAAGIGEEARRDEEYARQIREGLLEARPSPLSQAYAVAEDLEGSSSTA